MFERGFILLPGLLAYLIALAYQRGRRRLTRFQHVLFFLGYAAGSALVSYLFLPLTILDADARREAFFATGFVFNSPVPFANWCLWLQESGLGWTTALLEGKAPLHLPFSPVYESIRIASVGFLSTAVLTGTRLWMNHGRFPVRRMLSPIIWFVLVMDGLFVAQNYLYNPLPVFDTGILAVNLAGIPASLILYSACAWTAHRIKEAKQHGAIGDPDPKPV